MEVEYPIDQTVFLGILFHPIQKFKFGGLWRFIQKEVMDGMPHIALVGTLFYRFEQFLLGAYHHTEPEPKGLFNEQFDFVLRPFGMLKDQVATLDVGPDLGKPMALHQGLEFLHGNEVLSSDIDSPEQGDPGFHVPKSTGFNRDSVFPYDLPSFKFGWGYPIPSKIALVQVQ